MSTCSRTEGVEEEKSPKWLKSEKHNLPRGPRPPPQTRNTTTRKTKQKNSRNYRVWTSTSVIWLQTPSSLFLVCNRAVSPWHERKIEQTYWSLAAILYPHDHAPGGSALLAVSRPRRRPADRSASPRFGGDAEAGGFQASPLLQLPALLHVIPPISLLLPRRVFNLPTLHQRRNLLCFSAIGPDASLNTCLHDFRVLSLYRSLG
jgi:hypothetical protein